MMPIHLTWIPSPFTNGKSLCHPTTVNGKIACENNTPSLLIGLLLFEENHFSKCAGGWRCYLAFLGVSMMDS